MLLTSYYVFFCLHFVNPYKKKKNLNLPDTEKKKKNLVGFDDGMHVAF